MKNINTDTLHSKKLWSNDIIIDVRTPEEYHLEHIQWSINMPVDQFDDFVTKLWSYDNIYIYCNTGNSSTLFAKKAQIEWIQTTIVVWWLSVWSKKYPTIKQKWALPMMQQVQIGAGSLVLLGIILSLATNNWQFIILSTFVWVGLVFAGSTGYCGMAKALAKMPWNRIKNKVQTEFYGKNLIIKQFEDKNLAHYSYIAISDGEAIVVDPERDPSKYYDYAAQHNAKIVGIYETHPHADFASSHLEIHKETWATIYIGELVWAEYPHTALQDEDIFSFGSASVKALFTPWHSPDSFSFLIMDAKQKQIGLCTGDWVFIGDVGRADLRESVGNIQAKQKELAEQMYDTTRSILPNLDQSIYLLPTHGSGSLCGKWLSKRNTDTLGSQLIHNPILQKMDKDTFVQLLTSDQPNIPAYFVHSVLQNKKGNTNHKSSIQSVTQLSSLSDISTEAIVIDTRDFAAAINYPLHQQAISIPHKDNGFVTLLGSLVQPSQQFVLIVEQSNDIYNILHKVVSIAYEWMCQWVYAIDDNNNKLVAHRDDINTQTHIILDVRNMAAYTNNQIHSNSIHIPLEELQQRINEIKTDKILIPYCGGEYKSSIALSMIKNLRLDLKIQKWPSDIIL
jgi:hydroxyacylglutathione hydrolase